MALAVCLPPSCPSPKSSLAYFYAATIGTGPPITYRVAPCQLVSPNRTQRVATPAQRPYPMTKLASLTVPPSQGIALPNPPLKSVESVYPKMVASGTAQLMLVRSVKTAVFTTGLLVPELSQPALLMASKLKASLHLLLQPMTPLQTPTPRFVEEEIIAQELDRTT